MVGLVMFRFMNSMYFFGFKTQYQCKLHRFGLKMLIGDDMMTQEIRAHNVVFEHMDKK